ncbi:MAG: hypothetical protein QUS35_07535 [bacterium]|nr:hypothetical protein [bacterium]
MTKRIIRPESEGQLELLDDRPAVVHFWDKGQALRTGRLAGRIKRGKKKGQYVVVDSTGKRRVCPKIRNIE